MLHYAVGSNFRSLDLESSTDHSGVSLVSKTAGNGFIMVTCKITSGGYESRLIPSSKGEGPKS